ncbi:MAG: hypothetical protein KAW46_00225 [candidate division Zixibacteria bacterium]|nr:hypothetical protein [candidate division Zixibacteria bacterium]
MDATVQIVFSVCADSTGSACTWTEVHLAVEVTGGLFNVILGSITPITDDVFSGAERWLGINVGGEVLPHTRLVSVAYAHHAAVADTAYTTTAGLFPAPAWNSGWVTGESGTLTHGLGGDPNNYVVDSLFKDIDRGLSINIAGIGQWVLQGTTQRHGLRPGSNLDHTVRPPV